MTKREYFSKFFDGYLDCALWCGIIGNSESGEPTEAEKSMEPTTRAIRTMRKECLAFVRAQWATLKGLPREPSDAGHDFYLSRNGEGTGFWDRGLGSVGDSLHEAAKVYGSQSLMPSRESSTLSPASLTKALRQVWASPEHLRRVCPTCGARVGEACKPYRGRDLTHGSRNKPK